MIVSIYKYILLLILIFIETPLFADNNIKDITNSNQQIELLKNQLDTLNKETDIFWIIITGVLVFFMQAGFALVESGFIRKKNTVNILTKNLVDVSIGVIGFYFFGFSIMFAQPLFENFGIGKVISIDNLLLLNNKPDAYNFSFFFFQSVFCATSATIVSGAMAERTKFISYFIASFIISAFIYPVFGSLAWGNLLFSDNHGFLYDKGFIDFAGSTVVHSMGGWIGLAGSIVLGPRIGKYLDGIPQPIMGHSLPLSTLGVFILWLGWFGFNPGSTLTIKEGNFAIISLNTHLAASSGAIGSLIISWILFRKADLTMILNGVLSGLVAITSPCNNVSPTDSIIIGFIAGILVVLSVLFFDYIKVDDPVGAISVHGICGVWGTISAGLFAHPSYGTGAKGLFYGGNWNLFLTQLLGVGIAFVWGFFSGLILFLILKYTIGLRVPEEEEIEGLDTIEHGNEAYENHE
ncbi:MAG: ammonium transporter [Leptospiraceae bacterium]|nr:MAG: ammonium transporter [Leptospiraceae bacterium]